MDRESVWRGRYVENHHVQRARYAATLQGGGREFPSFAFKTTTNLPGREATRDWYGTPDRTGDHPADRIADACAVRADLSANHPPHELPLEAGVAHLRAWLLGKRNAMN